MVDQGLFIWSIFSTWQADNHKHMFRLSDTKMNLEFPSGQPLVSSPGHHCYCYYYCYNCHFIIIVIIFIIIDIIIFIIIIIIIFMMCRFNECAGDLVVMRVLSDFYWRLVQKFSRFCLRHQNMSLFGIRFLGLCIGGLSHKSCMSLHIGTNNIVGGSHMNR